MLRKSHTGSRPNPGNRKAWVIATILIILSGIVLRTWNFHELHFTHDELSAWYRLNFNNLPELLEKGVMVDGHPAFTQVLLYFWTGLFGDQEWVVKLPFLAMGIASLPLSYSVARRAFGSQNALITLAFVASSQSFVQYSTIARPYIVGLFFSLILVRLWLELIDNNKPWIYAVTVGIVAALCAYVHHFCALFALLVWLSGWLFIKGKPQIFRYAASGILGVLFYLPHLRITLIQLKMGGVGGPDGWLAPPSPDFISSFASFLVNYEPFLWLLPALATVFSFQGKCRKNLAIRVSFFLWFGISLIIGYFYSTQVNPVLRYSVLIFASPFLFMSLIGHTRIPGIISTSIAVLILGLFSWKLVDNEFYTTMEKQPYYELSKLLGSPGMQNKRTAAVISFNPSYLDYYIDTDSLKFPVVWTYGQSTNVALRATCNTLREYDPQQVLVDYWDPAFFDAVRVKYPEIKRRNQAHLLDAFILTEPKVRRPNPDALYFEKIQEGPTTDEFIDLIEFDLDTMSFQHFDYLSANAKISTDGNVLMVTELTRPGKKDLWRATESNMLCNENLNQFSLPHTIRLWDHFKSMSELREGRLKIYLWNKDRSIVALNTFSIQRIPGNPLFYNIDEPYPLP